MSLAGLKIKLGHCQVKNVLTACHNATITCNIMTEYCTERLPGQCLLLGKICPRMYSRDYGLQWDRNRSAWGKALGCSPEQGPFLRTVLGQRRLRGERGLCSEETKGREGNNSHDQGHGKKQQMGRQVHKKSIKENE